MLQTIEQNTKIAILELVAFGKLESGDAVVVGCSTSEVAGEKIGTANSPEIASAILRGLLPVLREHQLFLAAQCCEHLNRALVVERSLWKTLQLQRVNALPQPKAGGSFATAAWEMLQHPVLVEGVKAAAGLDIGNTLIGMHLREVAVPVRLSICSIGQAQLVAARTRYKFVGGERAVYQQDLL